MQGVRPIERRDPPPRKRTVEIKPREDACEELFASGKWQIVGNLQADHIEASHPSISQAVMRKLRAGQFSVRAECDLHGLTQKGARETLIRFVEDAARRRLGCVRVIHGKGNNSLRNTPVLKTAVQIWLGEKRLSRYVLAYCSARPCDGGTGAVYVLVRKA